MPLVASVGLSCIHCPEFNIAAAQFGPLTSNFKIYLSKSGNVFVQISKCICSNLKMYLSKVQGCLRCPNLKKYLFKFENVFSCIHCPEFNTAAAQFGPLATNFKIYLSKSGNVFVQISKCICSNLKMYLSKVQGCLRCPNLKKYLFKFENVFSCIHCPEFNTAAAQFGPLTSNFKMYLSKSENEFVHISKSIRSNLKMYLVASTVPSLTLQLHYLVYSLLAVQCIIHFTLYIIHYTLHKIH